MMKFPAYILLSATLLMAAGGCTPQPHDVQPCPMLPDIYPDYTDVVVPCNIAPLNFMLRSDSVDAVSVLIKGRTDSLRITRRGCKMRIPIDDWQRLTAAERGNTLQVDVAVRKADKWLGYKPLQWHVSPDSIDAFITYRLIEPGYEVWNSIQIAERCIENFDERVLIDNSAVGNNCMNCHTHGGNRGDLSFFHLRGKRGGTILNRDGRLRKLSLVCDGLVSAAVYADFHPSGRYAVFSSNVIIPAFHALGSNRLEVFDTVSDIAIADFERNEILVSPLVADSTMLETFPTFSADGRKVYFCSAPVVPLPDSIGALRYSLCSIGFDAERRAWGDKVDTLWNASERGGSVCHPKVSPDGRRLLYTVADYGTFPIWHRETDLQMIDLQSGAIDSLAAVNSECSETYHSWSRNSRWIAFASKRYDGQYGRVYFAHVGAGGRASRAFVLPQSDPQDDDLTLKSYNIPDLSATAATFDADEVIRVYENAAAEEFSGVVNGE